jgi:hypothetical protein
MTLLLSLSNESFSVLLGDRRLTSNGIVQDDEANKLCVLFCDDARIVIAFTGIAAYGNFRTQDWLRDTLYSIGETIHGLDAILAELQSRASNIFSRFKGQPIAFLISGYRYQPEAKRVAFVLSNFENSKEVIEPQNNLVLRELPDDSVTAIGCTSALVQKDYSALEKMLQAGNPAPVVLRKAVQIVQRAAKDQKSRRLIGTKWNSGVVPRLKDTVVVNTYHSASAVIRAYGPDVVAAATGCVTAVTGMFLQTDMILSGPEIRKNDLCWCGSGKRFKSCHLKKFGSVYARLPMFRKPMCMVVQYTMKEPLQSGRFFCVASSFA